MPVTILVHCFSCHEDYEVKVISADLEAWKNGKHIQYAFPYLSVSDRELLISRTCNTCFNKMCADMEEE